MNINDVKINHHPGNNDEYWLTLPHPYKKDINKVAFLHKEDKSDVWCLDIALGNGKERDYTHWLEITFPIGCTDEFYLDIAKKMLFATYVGISNEL